MTWKTKGANETAPDEDAHKLAEKKRRNGKNQGPHKFLQGKIMNSNQIGTTTQF